jgi:hypothetical protein
MIDFQFQKSDKFYNKRFDLPELQQYYHLDIDSTRKPLKIKEFGIINKTTLMGVQKFGEPVSVINKQEVDSSETKNYLGIGDWTNVNDQLRLQLYYPVEGITINYMFKKDSNKWVLIDSKIMEE